MTTKPQPKPAGRNETEDRREARRTLHDLVGQQVLHALGGARPPAGAQKVEVRPLWGNHYRVNILVGAGAVDARIAQSFFLTTDEDGNVLSSTPPLRWGA